MGSGARGLNATFTVTEVGSSGNGPCVPGVPTETFQDGTPGTRRGSGRFILAVQDAVQLDAVATADLPVVGVRLGHRKMMSRKMIRISVPSPMYM